jgi:ATP-binding cassette, subfamily B, bacterial PglK
MIGAAVFETVGIGLIVPFVGIVTNPKLIQEQPILAKMFEWFGFNSNLSFIVFMVIGLFAIFLLKNIYLIFFYYMQYKVILSQQIVLSGKMFKEYLTKPYTFHLQRNSSELLRNINREVPKVFQGIIINTFQLLTELLVITLLLVLLLLAAPFATLTAVFLLGGSVVLYFGIFRKKLSELGKEQQEVSGQMIKWVNQGLGASKEVKVSGKEGFFIHSYLKYSEKLANNSRYISMLNQVPRITIETIVISIVLTTLLFVELQNSGRSNLITTMALFTMAAFRLMPSINRVIGYISGIRYSAPALNVVIQDMFENREDTNEETNSEMPVNINKSGERVFCQSIQLQNVSFRYPGQRELTIKNINLEIPIGSSVAFIGESGAGKTTIVDIILGVLKPEQGEILVDRKSIDKQKKLWQQKIGYIPQFIFLSDDTIRNNIAFGIDEDQIDDEAVWRALEQAQLKKFVQSLPEQLDTKVGEWGVRLSGGQRQRIGIARALYHNPEIIFMDEATSSLDNDTEKEIMKAIDRLKGEKTLIIIAHRLSTIKNCDIIFEINNGQLVRVEKRFENVANQ